MLNNTPKINYLVLCEDMAGKRPAKLPRICNTIMRLQKIATNIIANPLHYSSHSHLNVNAGSF